MWIKIKSSMQNVAKTTTWNMLFLYKFCFLQPIWIFVEMFLFTIRL